MWVFSEGTGEHLENSDIKEEDLEMRGSPSVGGVAGQLTDNLPENTVERWPGAKRQMRESEEVETAGDK